MPAAPLLPEDAAQEGEPGAASDDDGLSSSAADIGSGARGIGGELAAQTETRGGQSEPVSLERQDGMGTAGTSVRRSGTTMGSITRQGRGEQTQGRARRVAIEVPGPRKTRVVVRVSF